MSNSWWTTSCARRPAAGSPLPIADPEPAARIPPAECAGCGDREAAAALQAGGVLHLDLAVLLAVDPGRAHRDQCLARAGAAAQLLIDDDVGLLLVDVEPVGRQPLGHRRRL